MPYERLYEVSLMDDLHNYFPAVLYEPDRFRTVADLLHYVQAQARERFDLFSRGARMHRHHAETSIVGPMQRPIHRPLRQPMQRPLQQQRLSQQQRSLQQPLQQQQQRQQQQPLQSEDELMAVAHQMLRSILVPQPYVLNAIPQNLEPVIVRPTAAQIATSTTVETVVDEGDMCAICQDTVLVGAQVRNLNVCEHSFHIGCIDTWFTTNVHCPVCRHDIREAE